MVYPTKQFWRDKKISQEGVKLLIIQLPAIFPFLIRGCYPEQCQIYSNRRKWTTNSVYILKIVILNWDILHFWKMTIDLPL